MKKTLSLFATIGLMAMAFSACTNDYTCSCRIINGASDTTLTILYDGVNRASAEEQCSNMQTTWTAGTATATCTLSQ